VACFYGGCDNLPNTKAVIANIPSDRLALLHEEDEYPFLLSNFLYDNKYISRKNDTPRYEHLDFMWAKDTGTKICPKVLSLLKEYNPTT